MKNIDMSTFAHLRGGGTLGSAGGIGTTRSKDAFTLAEMMVVMLILSIVMAAMAPVMTTRNKLDQSSPWVWAENGSDAYYGLGDAQVAMIGQQEAQDTDTNSRLVISTGLEKHHILFKTDNTVSGRLELSNHSVKLGEAANGAQAESSNSVMIGNQALGYGEDSVAIGTASRANTYSTAVGDSSEASNSSTAYGYGTKAAGTGSVSLGYKSEANGSNSIAIGNNNIVDNQGAISIGSPSKAGANHAISLGMNSSATGVNSIAIGGGNESIDAARTNSSSSVAIGTGTTVSSNSSIGIGDTTTVGANSVNSIAIGYLATVNGNYGVAIGASTNSALGSTSLGYGAQAPTSYSSAIGYSTDASGPASVALGYEAGATGNYGISIGTYSVASGNNAIAIGHEATASNLYSTAVGYNSLASGMYSTAVGYSAKAKNSYNTAIGYNACNSVTGKNKVCIGANSGPISGSTEASNDEEIIYIGSAPKWEPNRDYNWAKNAVMVIHNGLHSSQPNPGHNRGANEAGPTVYINGNLVVRGYTFTVGRGDDSNESEPIGVLGNKNGELGGDQVKWYNNLNRPYSYWTSDRRLKYVGKESTSGLEKIKQLKVFNYTFKKDEKKTPHVGVIAQDLQKVFPDAVTKAKDGFLRIRFEDMFYAMINAIKELDSRITALEKENQQMSEILKQVQNDNRKLQDDNRKLQNDNKKFEARLNALEARLK